MASAPHRRLPDIDLLDAPRYRPVPDPTVSLRSPVLRRLHDYWRDKAERRLPQRADIDPIEIGADVRNVVLLDAGHDPLRFRWRLLGGDIVEALGRNVAGQAFEDIYPHPLYADVMRVFSRAVLTGLPVRHVGTARFVDRDFLRYESVHLPLFDDSGTVVMMFGGLHIQQFESSE